MYELDKEVAEALKWKYGECEIYTGTNPVHTSPKEDDLYLKIETEIYTHHMGAFTPSTDKAQAMDLLEKVEANGNSIHIYTLLGGNRRVCFMTDVDNYYEGEGETLCIAICKAVVTLTKGVYNENS